MSLEEYEKVLAEKRANLNKKPAAKAFKADPKEFEGMKSYTREVHVPPIAKPTCPQGMCVVCGGLSFCGPLMSGD